MFLQYVARDDVIFVSIEEDGTKYVQGKYLKTRFDERSMNQWTEEGSIAEFETKDQGIHDGQAVFLKSDGTIILASATSPFADENVKVLVKPSVVSK